MVQRLLALFSLLMPLLAVPAAGQPLFENPKRITEKDGLPDNSVRAIVQDGDGFIWIGTSDGLCRFDGSQFKIFQHNPEDSTSLIDNRVQNLMVDGEKLWIATFTGLSIMDLNSNKINNYVFRDDKRNPRLVFALLKDRQGTVWMGANGMGFCKYLPERDSFEFYRYDREKVAQVLRNPAGIDLIYSFSQHVHNDSIIYAGTRAGLLVLNKYSKELKWHAFPKEDKVFELGLNTFRRIYHHDDGLLYVGSWHTSVHVFDPIKKTFTPLPYQKTNEGVDVIKSTVSDIRRKSENELWITTGDGVALYNIQKQEVMYWKSNVLKEEVVYGIKHIDKDGRIWYGSHVGVSIFDPVVQQYSIYSYEHLNEAGSGFAFYIHQNPDNKNITVFPRGAGSLFELNWENKKWEAIKIAPQYLDGRYNQFGSRGMSVAPDGSITVGKAKRILSYDLEKKSLKPLDINLDFVKGGFGRIIWDSNKRLWINANYDGLLQWDFISKKLRVFKKELEPGDPPYTTSAYSHLFEDSRGNMWMSREGGMSIYLHEKDTIVNHLFVLDPESTFPTFMRFCEDNHGRVWAITERSLGYALAENPEKGLVKKMDITKYTGKTGFGGINKDIHGKIWAWAGKCLLKINPDNPDNPELKTYSFEYGADGGDFFSFYVLPSGHFAFGSRNRIYITHPDRLTFNRELPEPYLLGLDVLEKPIELPHVFHQVKEVNLEHFENFFSFSFAAKSFTLAEDNKFRYRLEGFDENWIDAKERRFANYTNVPSGEYIFKLQAANNEGIWNDELLELPITIATPWYLTWWFILSVIYFLGLIAYGIYKLRIAQIRKEERLHGEFEKKLASQEMTALRAQMNPHFLFNSLNSIDSFIIKNETHKASEYLNNFARLIRLILQNSRSNYVNLKDELESLDLYMQMESLRFKDKFQYEIKVDEKLEVENIDIPPMLMQPYIENAIWHGLMHKQNGQPGKVTLSIHEQKGDLHCVIEDNGIGRKRAMEIRANRPSRGKKSVGMKITKDRISMINKLYNTNTSVEIIDLKDNEGNAMGTKVELVIPI